MLRKIKLDGVGPSNHLEAEFAARLNLITGDNGLGKSFILEVAWWALTRTWPGENRQASPRQDSNAATITTEIRGRKPQPVIRKIPFDFKRQRWIQPVGSPELPGLVIFAQVDGGFAVWDPSRNYWKDGSGNKESAYIFEASEVWSGLQENGQWRCNGLYRDWASWQREDNESFRQLKLALEKLSPPGESLKPGALKRISTEDSQDYPSIRMPYGIDVALIHASAAIRRIMALAYLLIWAWSEHLLAAKQRRESPTKRLILLVDEVEAHLHPSWQKRILPALFQVVEALTNGGIAPNIQVICTTHSPLVCVSMESFFDEGQDRIFDLNLDPKLGVRLDALEFRKLGTSENWLESEYFDLKSTYAEETERVLEAAGAMVESALKDPSLVNKKAFKQQDSALRKVLTDMDPFWERWRLVGLKLGWLK